MVMDKDQKQRSGSKKIKIKSGEKSLTKALEQTWGSVAISKFMAGLGLLVSLDFTLPPRSSIQGVRRSVQT